MIVHFIFDILSYIVAFAVAKYFIKKSHKFENEDIKWYYYTALIVGFSVASVLFSSINNYLTLGHIAVGKSVLGAIFGAVVAVEIFKYFYKIKGSTGAYFVPSLAIGIAIGRVGCFFAGLDDFTYGTKTSLPWGVDFGDGVLRHPVQLYESMAMFVFFIYSLLIYKYKPIHFKKFIFYEFIAFYATSRFFWELLKPYKDLALGINIFGWLCLILIIYSIGKIYGTLQR